MTAAQDPKQPLNQLGQLGKSEKHVFELGPSKKAQNTTTEPTEIFHYRQHHSENFMFVIFGHAQMFFISTNKLGSKTKHAVSISRLTLFRTFGTNPERHASKRCAHDAATSTSAHTPPRRPGVQHTVREQITTRDSRGPRRRVTRPGRGRKGGRSVGSSQWRFCAAGAEFS